VSETVGVVVGTYGDQKWADLAETRALPSARNQTRPADRIIHMHLDTLAEARNQGAIAAATRHLVFLDSDDELDPGYLEAMMAGTGDLRQPSTLGVYPDGTEDEHPVLIPARDLRVANYLVIGTMVRRELFLRVGGFRELEAWEDWDLFTRMWLAGGVITACPDAIYRVHVNPAGRNQMSPAEAGALYSKIKARSESIRREV
jgi:glycosyltransferase involved in cell wall biosynthesis